jgi:hypothetical protein
MGFITIQTQKPDEVVDTGVETTRNAIKGKGSRSRLATWRMPTLKG